METKAEILGDCQCTWCNCCEAATTRDDSWAPVCDKCKSSGEAAGEYACENGGWGKICPSCHQPIQWDDSPRDNAVGGTCECGTWRDENRSTMHRENWGNYSYSASLEPCPEDDD